MADEKWSDALPEAVRGWDETKNSDTQDKFWDQMTNMRSRMGSSIRIPSENASTEDMQAFHEKLTSKVPGLMPTPDIKDKTSLDALYARIGRPKTADEYKMPGKLAVTDQVKAFMTAAHELGLTQAQFEGVVGQGDSANKTAMDAMIVARSQANDTLKTEWGDTYVERMSLARSIAAKTGAPAALLAAAEKGTLDAETSKWLYGLSQAVTPEGTNLTDDHGGAIKISPEEAQNQINEIMGNPEHDYWHAEKVGNKAAIALIDKLYSQAYPDDSKKAVNFSGQTVGIGGLYGN